MRVQGVIPKVGVRLRFGLFARFVVPWRSVFWEDQDWGTLALKLAPVPVRLNILYKHVGMFVGMYVCVQSPNRSFNTINIDSSP